MAWLPDGEKVSKITLFVFAQLMNMTDRRTPGDGIYRANAYASRGNDRATVRSENCEDMLSRFHLIPERNGQTDGRTDGQICYINIARQYANAR